MNEGKSITEEKLVADWAKYCVLQLQKQIEKKGIDVGALSKSINARITGGASPTAILFSFRAYGRFVDMGVGKGVSLGSRAARVDFYKTRSASGKLNEHKRKAKKWYSRPFNAQVHNLTELLMTHFGKEGINVFEEIKDYGMKINY